MKLSECYDSEYASHGWGRSVRFRPAITAKRARQIFDAARAKMNPNKRGRINKGLTVGQSFEILSGAITADTPDEMVLDSLISRNIVREFGAFL